MRKFTLLTFIGFLFFAANTVAAQTCCTGTNHARANLQIQYNDTGAKFTAPLINIFSKSTFTTNDDMKMRKHSAGMYTVSEVMKRMEKLYKK